MRKIFKNSHSSSDEKKYYKREGKQIKEEHEIPKTLSKDKAKPRERSSL